MVPACHSAYLLLRCGEPPGVTREWFRSASRRVTMQGERSARPAKAAGSEPVLFFQGRGIAQRIDARINQSFGIARQIEIAWCE